jgi:tetratricopeptide (TPR) repeat protein
VKVPFLIFNLLFSSILLEAQSDSIPSIPIAVEPGKEELYNRGLVYYKAQDYSEAILSLDSSLALDPEFIDARYVKALSLEKAGEFEKALAELEEINKTSPGFGDVDKRIRSYYLTVYLSKYWYYMIALLLITVLIMTLVGKTISYRKL